MKMVCNCLTFIFLLLSSARIIQVRQVGTKDDNYFLHCINLITAFLL